MRCEWHARCKGLYHKWLHTAQNSNVVKACGARLLGEPAVAARIAELKPAAEQRALAAVERVVDAELRRRANRVSKLCANYRNLKALIAARAADENHRDIPGPETGLLAIDYRQIGGEKVKVAKINIAVLQELRAISERIARELGEWRDQASVHAIKSPEDMPPTVLDMLEARAKAELAEVTE